MKQLMTEMRRREKTHLDFASVEQVLRHTLDEDFEEEAGVLEEAVGHVLVSMRWTQHALQVFGQLFMNGLVAVASISGWDWLRHKDILQASD
jgi:N-acetylmuramic acid 6-phosphate (MurNAc-6-P) etherase